MHGLLISFSHFLHAGELAIFLALYLGRQQSIVLCDLIFECIHGKVQLFILFFSQCCVTLSDVSFESQQSILQILYAIKVVFSLLLGEFIDVIQ